MFWGILGPILIIAVFIGIINLLQAKKPKLLPQFLRDWSFLPLPLRSLQPYDKIFTSAPCCKKCRQGALDEIPEAEIEIKPQEEV